MSYDIIKTGFFYLPPCQVKIFNFEASWWRSIIWRLILQSSFTTDFKLNLKSYWVLTVPDATSPFSDNFDRQYSIFLAMSSVLSSTCSTNRDMCMLGCTDAVTCLYGWYSPLLLSILVCIDDMTHPYCYSMLLLTELKVHTIKYLF